ncbi:MAG: ABC transporter substrate-binding protein [Pleurocapsa sp. SU_196_0]|nr:ABC transporter substrate-binding protein [Pleurocapsa sp. SU_196_0]
MKRSILSGIAVVAAVSSALLAAQAQRNRTPVTFWHSMSGGEKAVNALVDGFNKSQERFEVIPKMVGTYPEANAQIIAALRAKNAPVLFQAEIGFFPRLAEDNVLVDMAAFEKTLEPAITKDFFPALWNYGVYEGKRFGLPWNASTPVLFYNATQFRAKGLKPPTTWTEFATLAKTLSNRNTKGFLAIADSWQFEQMVLSRGGATVTADGKPNFTSKEVIEALEFLRDQVRQGNAIPRSLGESQFAILDFVRTKAFMAIASIANWPDILPYSVAFELGAAPLPKGTREVVPFGGAQLVVMRESSTDQQAGAWAFWQHLMKPESIVAWTKASYYVPVRRSALPLLSDWYAQNPYRKTAFEQFDTAVPRPRIAGYATWKTFLEEAMERVLKGGADVRAALEEAQRRSLASR